MDNKTQLNKTLINVVKEQLKRFGQEIGFSHDVDTNVYFKCQALCSCSRQKYQDGDFLIYIKDVYKFTTLEKPKWGEFIFWNGSVYKITSIDNSVKGIYKSLCEYVQEYNHTYKLTIMPSDSGALKVENTTLLTLQLEKDEEVVSDLSAYNFIWESTDEDIAKVDDKGNVTGISEGSTNITCTLAEDINIKATYTITVINNEVVLTLVGDHTISERTKYYNYTISDGRTTVEYEVTCDTDNINNFLINNMDGVLSIKPLNTIDCDLNVTVKSTITNKIILTDTIHVDTHNYTISATCLDVYNVGDTFTINPTLKDDDKIVSDAKFNYSSNNTDIATVDNNGLVTCIADGEVIISIGYLDKSTTISFTVVKGSITGSDLDNPDYDDGSGIIGVGRITQSGTYHFYFKDWTTNPCKFYNTRTLDTDFTVGDGKEMSFVYGTGDDGEYGYGMKGVIININATQNHKGTMELYGKDQYKIKRYIKNIDIDIQI